MDENAVMRLPFCCDALQERQKDILNFIYICRMTLHDFNSLSQPFQDEVISSKGDLLINYAQNELSIHIYRLADFFVKISADSQGGTSFETFVNLDGMSLFHARQD